MRSIFAQHLTKVQELREPHEKHNCLNSLIRSMLHHYAIGCVEAVINHTSHSLSNTAIFDLAAVELKHPSDSSPTRIIDASIVILREQISQEIGHGWFPRESATGEGLQSELERWVKDRNRTIAHGNLSHHDLATINPLNELLAQNVETCLRKFCFSDGKSFFYDIGSGKHCIQTISVHAASPVIIRRLRKRQGLWIAQCDSFGIDNSRQLNLPIPETSPIVSLGLSQPTFGAENTNS